MDLRPTIAICADYGFGAYAWLRTWQGPGGNVADSCAWGFDSHPITLGLQAKLGAWAIAFECVPPPWNGENANRAYDWADFNRRGVALAHRLKRELGSGVRVVYEAPQEDPNHASWGTIEFCNDGSVVRSKR